MALSFRHASDSDERSLYHPCPEWDYLSFNAFRERLATMEGIFLPDMQGYGGDRSWDEISSDLKPLLDHSDCEGELTPQECAQVASRLRVLLALWPRDESGMDYDRRNCKLLASCMEDCAHDGHRLVFC